MYKQSINITNNASIVKVVAIHKESDSSMYDNNKIVVTPAPLNDDKNDNLLENNENAENAENVENEESDEIYENNKDEQMNKISANIPNVVSTPKDVEESEKSDSDRSIYEANTTKTPPPGLIHNDKNKNNKNDKLEALRIWLTDIVGLEEYFDILVNDGWDDLDSLQDITEKDLRTIGIIKTGHIKKLLRRIGQLHTK